jgi:hypothetical protein
MRLNLVFLLICILISSLPIYSTLKKGGAKYDPSPKKGIKKKQKECCEIDSDLDSKVRLKRICIKEGKTSIEIKILQIAKVCTILENLTLKDNTGKKYKPLSYSGISHCPQTDIMKPGNSFIWEFEILDRNAKDISLSETEIKDLSAWSWNQVSLANCNF